MNTSVDEITSASIGAALKIHRRFGSCLLESAYELLMKSSLQKLGFAVQRQRLVSFDFDGMEFINAFRVDLLVNNLVVLEIKSAERTNRSHEKQLLTYLRILELPVGLLINFGQDTLKDGLKRVVNNLDPNDSPLLRVNHPHK